VSVTGGLYTVNQTTGVITFTPTTDWAGTAGPVTYQATNSLSQVASSTYTPTVVSVPTANPDTSTGDYDTNQTINPLTNDLAGASNTSLVATSVKLCGLADSSATPPVVAETPPNCTKTTLFVPGEGTYIVDPVTGVVTFDPLSSFMGDATPVAYQVADSQGQITNATIAVHVDPPPLPLATPDAKTDTYDTNQVINPLTNDTAGISSYPLVATTVKLCGLADSSATPPVVAETPPNCTKTTLVVAGEGTYTVDPTTGVRALS
jgi:CshA-type fibril repeat protein